MGVRVKGSKRLMKNLKTKLPKASDEVMYLGLKVVAAEVKEQSLREVPRAIGDLARSVKLTSKATGPLGPWARIAYGTNYAAMQHENPDLQHAPGRKWKYLEDPIKRAMPTFAKKVAEKGKREFARRFPA